jgi:hypothetical protein
VHGKEIAGIEQRDEIAADRTRILDRDHEAIWSEIPHAHPVDDVAAGAVLGLREIKIGAASHLGEGEV